MGYRTNKATVVKTFRFDPALIEDVERVIFLTKEGDEPKYPTMVNFITIAVTNLIRQERGKLEHAGVVWEHLRPGFKQQVKKGVTDG